MVKAGPTKEISQILFVSTSPVKTHRFHIMEKLQIENLSQLIQFAIRLGIVEIARTGMEIALEY